jgi:hypothetical protein
MIPALPIEIACPKCGTKHVAQVQSIIDVGQDPQLKAALLGGQLNTVTCPACGALGAVSTPLLYHDADKELLLLFVPPELSLPMEERERLTGNMVNALMSTVPAEKRKGYFLNPRTALTRQSLIEDILQADGITKEMIAEQRARSVLLQDLLAAMDEEQQLKSVLEQHEDQIDYSFFLTLAAAAQGSAEAGQQELADRILKLRELLLARVPVVLPEPLPLDTSPSEVVDRVLAAKDEQTRTALAMHNRPLLDYAFFQELTRRIEQAAPEEAESLRSVRAELLEVTEQLDKEAQALQEAKIKLLQAALDSPDPAQTLRQRQDEVDLSFMTILGAALRQAQEKGEQEKAEQLLALNETVLSILQEGLPPQLRMVNELLDADYPEETRNVLQERSDEWDAETVELLEALAADLESQGRKDAAHKLRQIRGQAEEILQDQGEPVQRPQQPGDADS